MSMSVDEFTPPTGTIGLESSGGTAGLDSGGTYNGGANSGALTVTGSDLIYAVANEVYGSGTSITPGSGFTAGYVNISTTNYSGIAGEYALNITSGLNPAMTLGGSPNWSMASMAIKGTGSGPTTATLSEGAASGLVGVASANFTVTLDQAAQTGGVSCPITSSVGGDTITSTPVVIASGNSTGTFTITPSTVGSRNITLGTTTPSLTIAGSPQAYNSLATGFPAMLLGL